MVCPLKLYKLQLVLPSACVFKKKILFLFHVSCFLFQSHPCLKLTCLTPVVGILQHGVPGTAVSVALCPHGHARSRNLRLCVVVLTEEPGLQTSVPRKGADPCGARGRAGPRVPLLPAREGNRSPTVLVATGALGNPATGPGGAALRPEGHRSLPRVGRG